MTTRLTVIGPTLPTLPPKRAEETETSWTNPWEASEPAREIVTGKEITDAINADPDEVARLRKSIQEAREGHRSPRRPDERSN